MRNCVSLLQSSGPGIFPQQGPIVWITLKKRAIERWLSFCVWVGTGVSPPRRIQPTPTAVCTRRVFSVQPDRFPKTAKSATAAGVKELLGNSAAPAAGSFAHGGKGTKTPFLGGAPSVRGPFRRAKFEWRFPLLPGHWARFLERKLSKELCAKLRFASSGTAWPVPCCFARWCSAGA